MPTQGYSPIPVDLGSATSDIEEGRTLFQDRLRLYTGWTFVLAFGFYLMNASLGFAIGFAFLREAGNLWHLAACVVVGGVWLTTRTKQRSRATLTTLDATGLILACLFFAAMGAAFALNHTDFLVDAMHATLIAQLACMSTVLTRAVALPSTPHRTFWLGLAALAPQMSLSTYVLYTSPNLPQPPGLELSHASLAAGNLMNNVAWSGVALAISTVGSKVM